MSRLNTAGPAPVIRPPTAASVTLGSGAGGNSRFTLASVDIGSVYNGVTVRIQNDGTLAGNTATVSWNPVTRVVQFNILAGTTTVAALRAALTGNLVLSRIFTVTVGTAGLVEIQAGSSLADGVYAVMI